MKKMDEANDNGLLARIEPECRFQYLSPTELNRRLDEKAILYFPTGSLEWHNEHLPLGTDTFVAYTVAQRLCMQTGGVVLPPFWWNTGACHRSSSTYYMSECHYRSVLKTVCTGFRDFKAKLLVLVNGHGGDYQYESMAVLAKELNAEEGFPMKVVVPLPADMNKPSSFRMDHADTYETSVAMALLGQLVRMDREIGLDLHSHKMPFAAGAPSQDLGRTMMDEFLGYAKAVIEREYLDLAGE